MNGFNIDVTRKHKGLRYTQIRTLIISQSFKFYEGYFLYPFLRSDTNAKRQAMRCPNGKGSVVKFSGKRRQPFEVRVTRMDERNYPVYDVLGRFEDRDKA